MLTIHAQPLPYVDQLPERPNEDVTLLVIHCTELPDLDTARAYGERILYADSATGASGHYYVDRDGSVVCYVPGTHVTNHVRGWNAHSIGIELVNLGRYPHWWDSRHQRMTEPYPAAQIDALRELVEELRRVFPHLAEIAGHEDLDTARMPASDDPTLEVARKMDPGPLFPWDEVERWGLTRRRAG